MRRACNRIPACDGFRHPSSGNLARETKGQDPNHGKRAATFKTRPGRPENAKTEGRRTSWNFPERPPLKNDRLLKGSPRLEYIPTGGFSGKGLGVRRPLSSLKPRTPRVIPRSGSSRACPRFPLPGYRAKPCTAWWKPGRLPRPCLPRIPCPWNDPQSC